MVAAVKWNNQVYLMYSNYGGRARLINSDGVKVTSIPLIEEVKVLAEFPTKSFEGISYVKTRVGVFSCSTGRKITRPDILRIFR